MPLPLTIKRLPAEADQPIERTLRGTFSGVATPSKLPAKCLKSLIPRQSGIEPIKPPAKGHFPVWFLFGQQRDVRNVWGSFEFQYGFGIEYDEVLLLIPDLRVPAVGEQEEVPRVTLYARIYLNSLMSMTLGRFLYGFTKHHARFVIDDRKFVTFNRHGEEVFHATYERIPESVSTESAVSMKSFLETPVVFAGRQRKPGNIVVRHFEYDVSSVSMSPITADVRVDHRFTRKFDSFHFCSPALEHAETGAFHCEFPWVMRSPLPAA